MTQNGYTFKILYFFWTNDHVRLHICMHKHTYPQSL
jgi:hypothetical protein